VDFPTWHSIEANWQKLVAVAGLTFLSFRYFRKTKAAIKSGMDVALYPFVQLRVLANALDGLSGEMRELRGSFEQFRQDTHRLTLTSEAAHGMVHHIIDESAVPTFQCELPSGNCVYVNRALATMFGLSVHEMLGNGWLVAVHPEDRGRISENWLKACTAASTIWVPYDAIYRIPNRKNGEWMTVQATAKILRGSNNTALLIMGTVRPLAYTTNEEELERLATL